jgi:hypothetical protein
MPLKGINKSIMPPNSPSDKKVLPQLNKRV